MKNAPNIIEVIPLKYGNFSTKCKSPHSHYPTWPSWWAIKVINMSLEGYLEKWVCFSLLAKGCQTWDRVGRPVVAKICKLLQNLAIANTWILTFPHTNSSFQLAVGWSPYSTKTTLTTTPTRWKRSPPTSGVLAVISSGKVLVHLCFICNLVCNSTGCPRRS